MCPLLTSCYIQIFSKEELPRIAYNINSTHMGVDRKLEKMEKAWESIMTVGLSMSLDLVHNRVPILMLAFICRYWKHQRAGHRAEESFPYSRGRACGRPKSPASPWPSQKPSEAPTETTIPEASTTPAFLLGNYLRVYVFYTVSTISLAPGCSQGTSLSLQVIKLEPIIPEGVTKW